MLKLQLVNRGFTAKNDQLLMILKQSKHLNAVKNQVSVICREKL